ncbi:MAG TPA: heme-dependent oxidative N-demethylase subunit alpha family protein [Opitutaceae bacterium]|nr:heme-dependent oxidative N-demethylase subunit alpha family protein [Opitutaceae bacterium]
MSIGTSLTELFPDGDYRFHLTLRRGEPADFFRPQDPTGRVLAERRRWLAEAPARYGQLQPAGEASCAEFAELAAGWGIRCAPTIVSLGGALEPDLLFLSPDAGGRFVLRGGALCFPTGWALEEKIGHPMELIHGVVPGLNAALASPIQQFLSKLKPGVAFLRDNWGLAGTDELNLHPARKMAPPQEPVALDRLWLRVEHQALLALPRSNGIAFGIRIALHRMDAVARGPAAAGLRHALASMPADLADYKRLNAVRDKVIALL